MTAIFCLMLLFSGFPGDSDANYRFMSTCRYNGDWVETDDTWFGLFETDSTFELRAVELQLRKSTAHLYEGERPHPFIVELVGEPDWPMIILSSSETEFIEGEVATALRNYQSLVPDTSFVLEAPGIQETLLSTTEEGLILSDYVVCQSIGLNTNTAFSDYIQLYKGDKKMLISSIQRIKDVSSRILSRLK